MIKWIVNVIRKSLEEDNAEDSKMDLLISKGYYKHVGNGQFSVTKKGREAAKLKAQGISKNWRSNVL